MNKSAHRLSLHERCLKNARLVKLFKRTKFVKKLDLSQLLSKNRDIYSPALFYIAKKMQPLGVQVSAIARGVSFGGDLEYADELTLGRSIVARTPYAGH